MAYNGERIEVGDVPVKILEGADGVSALVKNADEDTSIDLGGPDVATGEGFELPFGEAVRAPLNGRDDDLWAVAPATETVIVHRLVNA